MSVEHIGMPRGQVTWRGDAGISNGYLNLGRGIPSDMISRGYPSSGRGKERTRGQSSSGRGVGYGVNIRGHSALSRDMGGALNISEHHAPGRGVGGAVSSTGHPASGIGGDVSIRGRTASGRGGDVSSRGYPASRRDVGGNLNFRSHYAAGRGVESDISSRGHPTSGKGVVSSGRHTLSGRGAVSSRGHPASVRGAVRSRGHPASVRGAISSRGHPASWRGAVSSRGHPASVRGAVSSRGHPASVRGAVSSREYLASGRGAGSSRGHPVSGRGAGSSRAHPVSGRGAYRGHPASVRGAVRPRGRSAYGSGAVSSRGYPSSGSGAVSSRGHHASGSGTVRSKVHHASSIGVRGNVNFRGQSAPGKSVVGDMSARGHPAPSRDDISFIGHNVSGRGMNSSAHNGMLRAQVESRYNRIVRGDRKSRGPYGMLRRGRRQMVSGMSTVGQGGMMFTVGQGGNMSTEGQEEIMSTVRQGHMRSTAAQGDMIFAEGPGGTVSTLGQRGMMYALGPGDIEMSGVKVTNEESIENSTEELEYGGDIGIIEESMAMGCTGINEELDVPATDSDHLRGSRINIVHLNDTIEVSDDESDDIIDQSHDQFGETNLLRPTAVQENMPDETFSITNVSPAETVGVDLEQDSNANLIKSNLVTINQSEVDLDSVEFIIELDQNFNTEVRNSSIQQPENLLRKEENKSSAVLLKSSSKPDRFESSRNKSMYVTCYPDVKVTEEILDSSPQDVDEYPCDQCNWILISPKQLKKHQQAMHKIKTTYNPNTEVNSSLLDDQNENEAVVDEKTENHEGVDIEENEISSPLIDTEAVAKSVRSNLLRTNMPMTEFAASVLGLSQWTVLILLNNPKPWTQLSREEQSCYETMKLWIDARATDRVDSSENVVDLIKDVDKLPKFNRAFVKMVPLNLSKYGIKLDDYM